MTPQDAPPTEQPQPMPLTQLRLGERAVVTCLALSGRQGTALRAMGLCEKACVRVCRHGEPCIVEVSGELGGGRRIGLARGVTDAVLVSQDRA